MNWHWNKHAIRIVLLSVFGIIVLLIILSFIPGSGVPGVFDD